MANAGASIEAFLKLDATNFRESLSLASTEVTNFKKKAEGIKLGTLPSSLEKLSNTIIKIGENLNTFVEGSNRLSEALNHLVTQLDIMNEVDKVALNNFKTMATSIKDISNGLMTLSQEASTGGVGIEQLNTIINAFKSGMSSAEVTIRASASKFLKM